MPMQSSSPHDNPLDPFKFSLQLASRPPPLHHPPSEDVDDNPFAGDPFDSFDDFAHYHSTPLLSPWVPGTPSHFSVASNSTTPTASPPSSKATPSPSPSPSPSTPLRTPPIPPSLRNLSPAAASTLLSTTVRTLLPHPPASTVPPRYLRPALQTLTPLLPVTPTNTLIVTHTLPLLAKTLTQHFASPSLSTHCCYLLSLSLLSHPHRILSSTLPPSPALRLTRDVIAHHLARDATPVEAALRLAGTFCLVFNPPSPHPFLETSLPRWTFSALRQWRDVPRVQTSALRLLAAAARSDREVALHLVVTYAVFDELLETLTSALAEERPRVVADVCETILVFLQLSAEFRRLSICDRVHIAVIDAARRMADNPRVAHAFGRVVITYIADAETRPILLQGGVVDMLVSVLVSLNPVHGSRRASSQVFSAFQRAVYSPPSTPSVQSASATPTALPTPSSTPTPTPSVLGEEVAESEANMVEEPLTAATSVFTATSTVLSALATAASTTSNVRSALSSRPHAATLADIMTRYCDDVTTLEACFKLLCTISGAFAIKRSRKIDRRDPNVCEMSSCTIDAIIRLSGAALVGYANVADVARPACLLLLNACCRGYRRTVLRRIPKVAVAIEQVLQIHSGDDSIAVPAGALLMTLR